MANKLQGDGKIMQGTHLIANYEGVEYAKLNDEDYLMGLLYEACKVGNMTVLSQVSYRFNPQGVTAILLLAESHISIHTAPELGKAHIDIYHCSNTSNVYVAMNFLKQELQPSTTDVTILQR